MFKPKVIDSTIYSNYEGNFICDTVLTQQYYVQDNVTTFFFLEEKEKHLVCVTMSLSAWLRYNDTL